MNYRKQTTLFRLTFTCVLLAFLITEGSGCSDDQGSPADAGVQDAGVQKHYYQRIGSFSDGLAPVRLEGLWGFIDKNGDLAIRAENTHLRPFEEGYTSIRKPWLWQVITQNGVKTSSDAQRFAYMGTVSEGLAAARSSNQKALGYIDINGNFVIPPQFDNADKFVLGLAPVKKDGKWIYINQDGTTAFETDFYRAYPFSPDGLALVRPARMGPYGFIGTDGAVKIPATFSEALPFKDGKAAVRENDLWGYIDTDGNYIITPRFQSAAEFGNGLAPVIESGSEFMYIDESGTVVLPGPYDRALPFSDGLAVVTVSASTFVIDTTGQDTGIAYGEGVSQLHSALSAGGCDQSAQHSVLTSAVAGFVPFHIINTMSYSWDVAITYTGASSNAQFIPGVPSQVLSPDDPVSKGVSSFTLKYQEFSGKTASGLYPLFDMTFSGTDASGNKISFTLSNSNNYTSPPPSDSHPFWDILKGAIDVVKGGTEVYDDHPIKGLFEIFHGITDIIKGVTDGISTDNTNAKTSNSLLTKLTGTVNGIPMSSLDGGLCGGDSYTISDNKSIVIQIFTAVNADAPPIVNVSIQPFGQYFAVNALQMLDGWRKDPSNMYLGFPYNCILQSVFEDYSDITNGALCSNNSYDYFSTASELTNNIRANDPLDWWAFANNFGISATDPIQVERWMQVFSGFCGNKQVLNCPVAGEMSLPQTSVSGPANAQGYCEIPVTVNNNQGPVFLNGVAAMGQTTCNTPATTCSFNLVLPLNKPEQGEQYIQVCDGFSPCVTISASCGMFIEQEDFTQASQGDNCQFEVPIQYSYDTVTMSGHYNGVSFDSHTCIGPQDSCSVIFSVTFDTMESPYLTDTQLITFVNLFCKPPGLHIPTTSLSAPAPYDTKTCTFNVPVNWPLGELEVDGHTITNNTCTTDMPDSCSFDVTVPAGFNNLLVVRDSEDVVPIPTFCYSLYSPNGYALSTQYSFSSTCSFSIPLENTYGFVSKNELDPPDPHNVETDTTCNGVMSNCIWNVYIYPPVDSTHYTFRLTDDTTLTPWFTLTCNGFPN